MLETMVNTTNKVSVHNLYILVGDTDNKKVNQ